MNLNNKSTATLHKLTEGLTFLMKKKFGEALLMIGSIDSAVFKGYHDCVFLKNLCHNALGYAYFSLGEHEESLKIYQNIQLDQSDENHKPFFYNIHLCEGIQCVKDGKLEEAIKTFESATDFLIRPEPYLFISVILIQRGLASGASS